MVPDIEESEENQCGAEEHQTKKDSLPLGNRDGDRRIVHIGRCRESEANGFC